MCVVFGMVGFCVVVTLGQSDDMTRMQELVATWSGEGCIDPTWTNATPVCSWSLVKCVGGQVNTIQVQDTNCTGKVRLSVLPQAVQYVYLNYNSFNGPLDFSHLPSGLLELTLTNNYFSGAMNLTKLPGTIINLEENSGLCGKGTMATGCGVLVTLPNHCTCSGNAYDCGAC